MKKTEESILMEMRDEIHKLSMSDDEGDAITGRFFKRFLDAFDEFETEERKRGSHRGMVIGSMAHGCAALLALATIAGAKPMHLEDAVDGLKGLFCMAVDGVVESDSEIRKGVGRQNSKEPSDVGSH